MTGSILPAVAVAAGILFVLLVAPIAYRETQRTRALDRRLAPLREQAMSGVAASLAAVGSEGRDPFRQLGPALLRVASMLVPVGAAEREKLAQLLRKAGFDRPEALSAFLACKLASALLLALGAGLWTAGLEAVAAYRFLIVLAGLAGLAIGGVVPEYGLRALAARRVRSMTSALPDALDMLVMCLEAGLTAERGMLTVAETLEPIEPGLAGEFRRIELELRLGSDKRAALTEYYRRTEIDGLRDFAMSLIQADRYGTPLSQSMKAIAADQRLQKNSRIATQAERLPVLMTLPMLLFVVPGTMLLVAGPSVMSAMSSLGNLGNIGGQ